MYDQLDTLVAHVYLNVVVAVVLGLFKNAGGDAGANVGTRRVRVDHEAVILEWQAIWRMGASCRNAADRGSGRQS